MSLDEKESELLKQWVTKKLESISDADSDVLADYVVALAKSDEPEPTAKANSVENLRDFLADSTQSFVDELFQALKTKSYDPSRPAPEPTTAPYQPPKRTSAEQPGQLNGSRKRSHHDWDRDEQAYANGHIQSFDGGERPMKHPRRGGRGHDLRGGRQPRQQYNMPQMPVPPGALPPLDPNDPNVNAMFMLMQQQLGLMPPPPQHQRCRDYDTKGFCAAGASCPFEHGIDPVVTPGFHQQYDPNHTALANIEPTRTGHMDFSQNARGRGGTRGRARGANNFRGGGKRSVHSHLGPSRDRTNTTIVVESIPEEKCNEQSIREFFSEFGNIAEVTLEPDKKLALVKYDSYDAAKAAYESPKVVFDNRFVKVFWYKNEAQLDRPPSRPTHAQNTISQDIEMQDDSQVDPAEVAKKQEEAQRKHEDARKQREEVEKQRLDLDTQLKAKEAERKRMADLLAKRAGTASSLQAETTNETSAAESAQTKELKAQLAKLEAEAKSLGINPDATTDGVNPYNSPRGRGGFRGRPRGRGYHPSYRGGYGSARGGAVMRLDNRPKTIAVTFAEGSYSTHEEALRQFLLFNNLDSANLSKHPDRDDTALIAFNQRFEGENFMAQATNSELTHIGKVDISWYKAEEKAANGEHELDGSTGQAETTEPQDDFQMAEDENLDHWS